MSERLYVEEAGSGDPVLFLPGFTASMADYSAIRARLALDYHVISVDLPGSGRSGPQPRNYTRTYYDDDARDIAALVRSRVSQPLHMVGHSDGGEVALLMAATEGKLARSVLTWGAAGALDESHRAVAAFYNVLMNDPSPDTAGYRQYLIDAYGEQNARATTESFAHALEGIIAEGGDISRSRAHRITCPVLLITGEHDQFAPAALINKYVARAPDAATWFVPGAGHDLHDTCAILFEDRVLDWIKAC